MNRSSSDKPERKQPTHVLALIRKHTPEPPPPAPRVHGGHAKPSIWDRIRGRG